MPAATKIPTTSSSETPSITMQTPDNVIGETLVVQGRVEFQNLLRIDGHFEVSAAVIRRVALLTSALGRGVGDKSRRQQVLFLRLLTADTFT